MQINSAILATLATLSCLPALNGCAPAPAHEEVARPVRTQQVGSAHERATATYAGEIKARREHALGFQIAGRIERRFVEVGSAVDSGTPLVKLDATDSELNAQAAMAQLDSARSQLAQARRDLARFTALAQGGHIARAELEKARLAMTSAAQSLEAAEANYRVAANRVSYTVLRAGTDGVVTAIDAEVDEVVQAGQVVIRIAEHGERELLVSVPESRVDELRQSPELTIATWAQPEHRYAGRLREIAPDPDSITRTYAARITVLEPDAALRLGMTAKLTADLGIDHDLRQLPLTAVYDPDGDPAVWVVDPNTSRVHMQRVSLAGVARNAVLVSEGLSDGDIVVTAGVHLLHDQQKVLITDSQRSQETRS